MSSRLVTLSARSIVKLIGATALAPLVAGAVTFLIFIGQWYGRLGFFPGSPYSNPIEAAISVAAGVTVIAFMSTVTVALPLLVWRATRGPLSLLSVLSIGAIVGQVPFIVIVASIMVVQVVNGTLSWSVSDLWYGWYGTLRAFVLGLLIGPSTAMTFWLVGIRRTELTAGQRS
jgi:hypothetical protein